MGVLQENYSEIPHSLSNPEELGEFYEGVMKSKFSPNSQTIHYYEKNRKENVGEFNFNMTDENEVANVLQKIKSKAVGQDEIGIDMLILCCPHILPVITHLINVCIENSTFPKAWKTSYIIPLPKNNHPSSFTDLRPVSILPTLSKVIEKICEKQIREHLNSFEILPKFQSGFRPGHSCATALLRVVDDILHATDINEVTILALLDYSKAFDKLNHKLLLAILSYVGFSHDANNFIRCYLGDRTFMVKSRNKLSSARQIMCGVPQGSILGPLLFAIYTSQLLKCVEKCSTQLYADDTQLYYSFIPTQVQESVEIFNKELISLANSSANHCLELNPTKSKILVFGREKARKKVIESLKITMDGVNLPVVSSAKNLGVEMDSVLRFHEHINTKIKTAFFKLKLIYSQKSYLNSSLKRMLCDSLVLSAFNYCDVLYNSCITKHDASRIQLIQNSCARLVCGIRRGNPISHKIKEIGWLRMSERRILHCLVLYHKVILNRTPSYLHEKIMLRQEVHNVNIRFKNFISPPPHNTAIFQRSFSFCIYKYYNQLPKIMKEIKSIELFKRRVRRYVVDSPVF